MKAFREAFREAFMREAKVRARGCSTLLLAAALTAANVASAAPEKGGEKASQLPLLSRLEVAPQPLTIDQVWALEPGLRNPQRATWVLDRDVRLEGLRAEMDGKDRYRVSADALQSVSTLHYRHSERFTPSDQLVSQTRQAARLWDTMLDTGKVRLSLLLSRLRAPRSELAVALAQETLQIWKRDLEQDWLAALEKSEAFRELSAWKSEWRDPPPAPVDREVPASLTPSASQEIAEKPRRLLARAPARYWNGVLSIHADVDFGGRSLSGRFLFDTGQAANLVSPSFLQAQGLSAVLVASAGTGAKGTIPIRLRGESRKARPLRMSELTIGGASFPLVDFAVTGTDFFGPPEYATPCCDGVIGFDFLRGSAFEVVPDPLAARVNVWMREGFAPPPGFSPVDAYQGSDGILSSDCRISSDSPTEAPLRIRVQWNTGQAAPMKVVSGFSSGETRRKGGRLECGEAFIWDGPELASLAAASPRGASTPVISIGMGVLGRGPFIVDASHGWLWLKKDALAKPARRSASAIGLELEFDFAFSPLPGDVDPGDRILTVRSIRPGSAAASLERLGLRPGMRLASLDGKVPAEWNPWKLEERFREAAAGKPLTIEWWEGRDSVLPNSNRPRGPLAFRKKGRLSVSPESGKATVQLEPATGPGPRG